MTTIIYDKSNGYSAAVEAIKVEPAPMPVEVPMDAYEEVSRNWLGRKKITIVPKSTVVIHVGDPNALMVTTAEVPAISSGYGGANLTVIIKNVGFEEYADSLTKSSNGVVDLRPLQRRQATSNTAEHS